MPVPQRLRRVAQLFGIFFKIGAFTFGGGYAMVPLIEHETSERRSLISKEEISDIVAISESTPGPIAINSATFVGYRSAGVPGAVAATLGVVLPSFCLILLIAYFLRHVMDHRYVQYAFFGIRAGVLALIVKAVVNFYKRAAHNVFSWCVMAGALVWAAVLDWTTIAYIALGGAAGLLFCSLMRKRGKMS